MLSSDIIQSFSRRTAASIRAYIESCQDTLHNIVGNDVESYERVLEDFQQHLKPTHYVVLTVKKFLGDLYGLTAGFTYKELSRERFDNKIEYLRDFISTISKVDPGYTKVRVRIH